jgi:hypothetical protein
MIQPYICWLTIVTPSRMMLLDDGDCDEMCTGNNKCKMTATITISHGRNNKQAIIFSYCYTIYTSTSRVLCIMYYYYNIWLIYDYDTGGVLL